MSRELVERATAWMHAHADGEGPSFAELAELLGEIRREAIEECGKVLGEEAVRMMGTRDERDDAQTVARCSMLVRKLAAESSSSASEGK